MASLRLIWFAELRRDGRGWLALALVAGLLFGVALTVAEAAHRADTVIPRYDAATRIEDAEVAWVSFAGGPRIDLGAAARLPQVEAAGRALALVPLGLVSDTGAIAHVGDFEFDVPLGKGYTETVDRPLLTAGRLPSPQRPDEVVVDQVMASTLGLHVSSGLRVRLLTYTEGLRLVAGTANWIQLADPARKGAGPLVRLHVVGVEAWREDVDTRGQLIASPAFVRKYRGFLGPPSAPYLAVRLRRASDLPAYLAAVAKVYPKKAPVFADPSAPFGAPIAAAIKLQAATVWLLAAAAAVMAFVGIAPALARRTLRASTEQTVLRTLGLPHRNLVASALAGPAVVAGGATALAVVVAVSASPLTTLGISRPFDPDSGLQIDWEVLATGAAAIAAAIVIVGTLTAWTGARLASGDDTRSSRSRSRAGARLFGSGPVPVTLGVANALERGGARLRVPVVSTIAAITAMIAVLCAGVVVATSATRLLETPRLYGQTYSVLGSVGGESSAAIARALRGVEHDPAAEAAAAGGLATVTIDGKPIDVFGTRRIKSMLPVSLTSGRVPAAPHEIALGRGTLTALHADVGDTVDVRGSRRTIAMRVVGAAVLPYLLWESRGVALGDGGLVTLAALRSLVPVTTVSRILVRIAPGVDPEREVGKLTRATSTFWSPQARPPEVEKITHVRSVPYLLVALIAVTAIAALAHLLVATTRRRRREIAILKTLGLSRRGVGASVLVQSATTALIGCLLGIPLGVVGGFWAWNTLANRMGVIAEPVLPAATVLLVPAALALCALVAVVPAALAARVPAAAVLRAE
jgi:hypothetical protein